MYEIDSITKKIINDEYKDFIYKAKKICKKRNQNIIIDFYFDEAKTNLLKNTNKKFHIKELTINYICTPFSKDKYIDLQPALYSWFYSQTLILLPFEEIFSEPLKQLYKTMYYFQGYRISQSYLIDLFESPKEILKFFNFCKKEEKNKLITHHLALCYTTTMVFLAKKFYKNNFYLSWLNFIENYSDIYKCLNYLGRRNTHISLKYYDENKEMKVYKDPFDKILIFGIALNSNAGKKGKLTDKILELIKKNHQKHMKDLYYEKYGKKYKIVTREMIGVFPDFKEKKISYFERLVYLEDNLQDQELFDSKFSFEDFFIRVNYINECK